MDCILIGTPTSCGAGRPGCEQGPSVLRAAGLAETLTRLGHRVVGDFDVAPSRQPNMRHPNPSVEHLAEMAGWTEAIATAVHAASAASMPILLGGDHSVSAGSLAGLARRARTEVRPLFVLWLDAHPDFHTLDSTTSGNLHGVPLAYACGAPGFDGFLPALAAPVDPRRVATFGTRSVDPAERVALTETGVEVFDMRRIDEFGAATLLRGFLDRVAAEGGMLHVSLDVDFLDPGIAPGIGTPVAGGATLREAHLVMEMLSESGLVTSLDLVELNPLLDARDRTAALLVDLVASLMGRRVMDRVARSA